ASQSATSDSPERKPPTTTVITSAPAEPHARLAIAPGARRCPLNHSASRRPRVSSRSAPSGSQVSWLPDNGCPTAFPAGASGCSRPAVRRSRCRWAGGGGAPRSQLRDSAGLAPVFPDLRSGRYGPPRSPVNPSRRRAPRDGPAWHPSDPEPLLAQFVAEHLSQGVAGQGVDE